MTLSAYRPRGIHFISIAVVLLFINGSALAQSSLATNPSLPPGESERIDAFLQAIYSGVIVTKTVTNSFGQTLSCVDIQHQPALNNPALTGYQIQLQPSPELRAILPYNVKEDDTLSPCPTGSVGMILPTREQIVRAGSLKNFRSKYPEGSKEGRFGVERNVTAPASPTE